MEIRLICTILVWLGGCASVSLASGKKAAVAEISGATSTSGYGAAKAVVRADIAQEGMTADAYAQQDVAGASSQAITGNASSPGSVVLDIPNRLQWQTGNGWCGEMSIQSVALYYGAWVSESVVRSLAGGELLLGVNEQEALDALKFSYSIWSDDAATPQANQFTLWLKRQIVNETPSIMAVYLSGRSDSSYDHIIPVVGVKYTDLSRFDEADEFIVNDLAKRQVTRPISSYVATRQDCAYAGDDSGCIPQMRNYGVAIAGILDAQHVTLPVRLSVEANTEPNVSKGAAPEQMVATVKVSGLQPGGNYTLLRYDNLERPLDVPTNATAAEFLASNYQQRVDFTAVSSEWTYQETKPFPSNGTTYYRCVPR
jgi:hypothetical protein